MKRILLLAGALILARAATADVPPLLVPPHHDSLGIAPPPAPLLVPGRPAPADTTRPSPERRAREQYALGRAFERNHQPVSAIVAYRNAVRLDPSIADAHYRMGLLYSAVKQHKAAAAEYAAELAHHPANPDANRWLGLEQAQLGDTTAAMRRLEDMTRRDSTDAHAWHDLGVVYASGGRAREGEAALRRSLALAPGSGESWRDLGALQAAQKREGEARASYAKAAKLAPADPTVWVNVGNLERRAGRLPEALAAYGKSIDRDSLGALAWRGRVTTLDAMGRPEQAADAMREWVRRVPDQPGLRMEAMERYTALGRRDAALALARDGVHVAPRSAEAHLSLGMALHENGHERASLAALRRAQALFKKPVQKARVGQLVGVMRAHAPDSLRSLFAADSVAFTAADHAAGPDSTGQGPR